jgi:hypothetical protein
MPFYKKSLVFKRFTPINPFKILNKGLLNAPFYIIIY